MKILDIEIGKRLRQIRKEIGWTIKEAAERCGMHPDQLCRYELNGTTSIKVLKRLYKIYNIHPRIRHWDDLIRDRGI